MAVANAAGTAAPGDAARASAATADGVRGHGDIVDTAKPVFRPKNRPDIDGLRALAVIPVVLFHAEMPYFTGGYVGVDVFFVISGFLITAILHREMAARTFSLVGFYERRSRRILPALFVMMAIVAPLCWMTLLSKDLADFGQSLVAAASFAANILFFIKTGYFDAPALTKPLLHTWSLAVEEQFYILFPLAMYATMRWLPKWTFGVVAALLLASFGLSVWQTLYAPSAAFYLPFGRAWELMIGSLLALGLVKRRLPDLALEALAAIGVALVVGSILVLDSHSLFPGTGALAPCVGTALLIYAGAGDRVPWTSRILANRLFVFVGLISYSLYLWHWPIIVLWQYRFLPTDGFYALLLLGSVFVISVLSWKYVELPVREGRIFRSRRSLFTAVAAGMAFFILLGGLLVVGGGLPQRLPIEVQRLERARLDRAIGAPCARMAGVDGSVCTIGGSGPADFLVWGDSHAGKVGTPMTLAAAATDTRGLLATANGCAPLLGLERRAHHNDCTLYNQRIMGLIRGRNVGTVFLVANWPTYFDPRRVRGGRFDESLAATLTALSGRRVFIVARVPGGRMEVPSGLARAQMFGVPERIWLTEAEYLNEHRESFAAFARTRRSFDFELLYPHRYLCAGGRCPVEANGSVLYLDEHHLTPRAGPYLAPMFERALRRAPAPAQ